LSLMTTSAATAAETYVVDKSHSEIGFRVRHLVSKVPGRFVDFEGTIEADKAKPAQSSVQLVIQAKSIDTSNAQRDEHLRSADFFDIARYPTIVFESRSVRQVAEKSYEIAGTLTMHGVSRPVTLPVELLGVARDPWGNERAGFATSTLLNRKDYGIIWNKTLDAGGLLLGDEVEITINLEAVKKAPAAR
jgi:polyisoprenoid-binding protein YceI